MVSERFILRYKGQGAKPSEDVEKVEQIKGIRVLDQTSRMMLVELPKEELSPLMALLSQWIAVPEQTIPLPDPRPKLKK